MITNEFDYKKVVISGSLTTTSDMHIGSGALETVNERVARELNYLSQLNTGNELLGYRNTYQKICNGEIEDSQIEEQLNANYHLTAKCCEGRPYIPGSTLRGALLNKLLAGESTNASPAWQNSKKLRNLFGFTDEAASNGEHKRKASKVQFLGAFTQESGLVKGADFKNNSGNNTITYFSHAHGTLLRQRVKINAQTGAAEEGKLFQHEVVPKGTVFNWKVVAENVTENELKLLLALLTCLDGLPENAIGASKNSGYGGLKWDIEKNEDDSPVVQVITKSAFLGWIQGLTGQNNTTLNLSTHVIPAISKEPVNEWLTKSNYVLHLPITLNAASPILVNDPTRVKIKSRSQTSGDGETPPSSVYMRDMEGNPIIPATSLKGVLRAQSAKIASTLTYIHAATKDTSSLSDDEKVDLCVEVGQQFASYLWGSEHHQSIIRLSNLTKSSDQPLNAISHHQHFNAVNRFTGGVKQGALFNSIASSAHTYSGDLYIDSTPLLAFEKANHEKSGNTAGWQALLLFTLRDALHGELTIGSGAAKGYGQFNLSWETLAGVSLTPIAEALNQLTQENNNAAANSEFSNWLNSLTANLKHLYNNVLASKSEGVEHVG